MARTWDFRMSLGDVVVSELADKDTVDFQEARNAASKVSIVLGSRVEGDESVAARGIDDNLNDRVFRALGGAEAAEEGLQVFFGDGSFDASIQNVVGVVGVNFGGQAVDVFLNSERMRFKIALEALGDGFNQLGVVRVESLATRFIRV